MEYTKTVWKDLPDTSTPITADRLNNIENGVEYLFQNESSHGINEYSQSTTDSYSCNYVNNINTYSTDEIRIGTWLDNKPIYRKSFYFTQWSGLGLDTSLDNIDNMINASVTLKNSASGQWMKLACNPDGSYGFYIKKTGNTYKIFISNENVYTADAVCSFIEYTKTTD